MGTWNLEALRPSPSIPASIRDSVFNAWSDEELPKPGLYFGSYSCHGMEVIEFRYERTASGRPVFEGRKISGDPNVPVNEISVRVFLDQPLILSSDDLKSLSSIQNRVSQVQDSGERTETSTRSDFRSQPFALPNDINAQLNGYEPSVCRGRFLGEGQIAGTDFFFPSFTEVIFEILGEGLLGVLWIHLRAHSLYFIADEQPTAVID